SDRAARQLRHALVELFHGVIEALNVGLDVGEKLVEKRRQFLRVAQRERPVHLLLVLEEEAGLCILENDVGKRVAERRLFLDLGVEVVLSVFGFPVAARQAVRVTNRAVRTDQAPARFPGELSDERPTFEPRDVTEKKLEG